MIKKIILWLVVILIMIGVVYQFFIDKEFDGYRGSLTSASEVKSLNRFLYSHDKMFVTLSIMIDDAMLAEIEESMKHSPNILFHAQSPDNPNRKVRYIIRTREDSRKEFILDKKGRKIEGVFKTYKQVTPKGETLINLIAINPAEFKKKNSKQ
jgi:hypothetical protein